MATRKTRSFDVNFKELSGSDSEFILDFSVDGSTSDEGENGANGLTVIKRFNTPAIYV